MDSVIFEESFGSRLKEVYKLQKGPRTLDELAKLWNQSFLGLMQTEKGKLSFDRLSRGKLAYGETSAETRHTVHLQNGRVVHVNCALDAMVEGFFQNVEIESSCPHCNHKINMKMVGREVVSTQPETTVLWFGISPHGEGPTTEVLCPFINFFTSDDHAKQWRGEKPEQVGVLLTVSQAHGFISKALKTVISKS